MHSWSMDFGVQPLYIKWLCKKNASSIKSSHVKEAWWVRAQFRCVHKCVWSIALLMSEVKQTTSNSRIWACKRTCNLHRVTYQPERSTPNRYSDEGHLRKVVELEFRKTKEHYILYISFFGIRTDAKTHPLYIGLCKIWCIHFGYPCKSIFFIASTKLSWDGICDLLLWIYFSKAGVMYITSQFSKAAALRQVLPRWAAMPKIKVRRSQRGARNSLKRGVSRVYHTGSAG